MALNSIAQRIRQSAELLSTIACNFITTEIFQHWA